SRDNVAHQYAPKRPRAQCYPQFRVAQNSCPTFPCPADAPDSGLKTHQRLTVSNPAHNRDETNYAKGYDATPVRPSLGRSPPAKALPTLQTAPPRKTENPETWHLHGDSIKSPFQRSHSESWTEP